MLNMIFPMNWLWETSSNTSVATNAIVMDKVASGIAWVLTLSNASRIVTGFFSLLPFRYRMRPASRRVKHDMQNPSIRKTAG